jgi:hypothetical protein
MKLCGHYNLIHRVVKDRVLDSSFNNEFLAEMISFTRIWVKTCPLVGVLHRGFPGAWQRNQPQIDADSHRFDEK